MTQVKSELKNKKVKKAKKKRKKKSSINLTEMLLSRWLCLVSMDHGC